MHMHMHACAHRELMAAASAMAAASSASKSSAPPAELPPAAGPSAAGLFVSLRCCSLAFWRARLSACEMRAFVTGSRALSCEHACTVAVAPLRHTPSQALSWTWIVCLVLVLVLTRIQSISQPNQTDMAAIKQTCVQRRTFLPCCAASISLVRPEGMSLPL